MLRAKVRDVLPSMNAANSGGSSIRPSAMAFFQAASDRPAPGRFGKSGTWDGQAGRARAGDRMRQMIRKLREGARMARSVSPV